MIILYWPEEFIKMDGFGKPFHKALFADAMLRIEDREMSLQTKAYPPGPCNPGKTGYLLQRQVINICVKGLENMVTWEIYRIIENRLIYIIKF